MSEHAYRVGVVGATGAVGSTILEVLAERGFPVSELVPFASERSAGKQRGVRGRPGGVPPALRRDHPGPRSGALLGRRRGELRVGAAVCRRGRGRGRQHQLLADASGGAARRRRDQPRCRRGPLGPDREPELLDDAADDRPRPDRAPGRDRADRDLDLSVGVRDRSAGRRRARGPGSRDPPRPGAAGAIRLSAPDRVQRPAAGRVLQGRRRLHDRGAQADGRDAQDPRARRRARDLGDLRPRAGVRRALAVGQRADADRALARGMP